MARPKQEIVREIEIKVRLSDEEYEEIKKFADHLEIPTSTFMRNLIKYAMKDAQKMEKIKLLTGLKKFSEWAEALSVNSGQAREASKAV